MNTQEKLQYDNLLYTMINEYGVKEITTQRQRKNDTRFFLTKDGERFGIYKSGYVRRFFTLYAGINTCYQINPTENYIRSNIFFADNKFKKVSHEFKHRIKIYSELGRLTYLFNFLVKNKYITKQTDQLNAKIKV